MTSYVLESGLSSDREGARWAQWHSEETLGAERWHITGRGRRRARERLPETWIFLGFVDGRPVVYEGFTRHLPTRRPFSRLSLARDQVWIRDVYAVPEYPSTTCT